LSLEKEALQIKKEYSDLKRTILLKNNNNQTHIIKIRCSCSSLISETDKFCASCGKAQ
jgi:ribosomal protein L37E